MDTEKNQNDTVIDNLLKVGTKGQTFIAKVLENSGENKYFRVAVESGGCSGFVYNFYVESIGVMSNSDTIVCKKPKVVVDAMSLLYLAGATLDLQEDISGAKLVLDNPQAVQGCGCGVSFTLEKTA